MHISKFSKPTPGWVHLIDGQSNFNNLPDITPGMDIASMQDHFIAELATKLNDALFAKLKFNYQAHTGIEWQESNDIQYECITNEHGHTCYKIGGENILIMDSLRTKAILSEGSTTVAKASFVILFDKYPNQ